MPELRQDIVTGRWVVIATERALRPESFTRLKKEEAKTTTVCPFCYGNEALTPPEIMAYRPKNTLPDTPGWTIRVVPNKYPAFVPEYLRVGRDGKPLVREGTMPAGRQVYPSMVAMGAHEVIVSSPDHHKSLALLSESQVIKIISSYRDRYLALKKDPRIRYILIIVNHGREAGASIEHPHSQVFAVPLLPATIKEELLGAYSFFEREKSCIFCHMIEHELQEGKRVILGSKNYIVFAPYASRVPFELWIMPKEHKPSFETISFSEIEDLASILRIILAKLYKGLSDPPYNYFIHTCPPEHREMGIPGYPPEDMIPRVYHWHIEILPKLSIAAGFELGTGIMINIATPENVAKYLREMSV
ncbi:MAG: galactose-1-phosphate uridylyltransferase [Actinomycetota bacterium]